MHFLTLIVSLSFTSGVPLAHKVDQVKEKESVPGSLPQGLQTLLCLKWWTNLTNLFTQGTKLVTRLPMNSKTEKPTSLLFITKIRNSPWVSKLSEAQVWLQTQEEIRLQGEIIDRPDTKWSFIRYSFLIMKVVLDRQPLQIGLGLLPDWLRNQKIGDCLWHLYFRCLAVVPVIV